MYISAEELVDRAIQGGVVALLGLGALLYAGAERVAVNVDPRAVALSEAQVPDRLLDASGLNSGRPSPLGILFDGEGSGYSKHDRANAAGMMRWFGDTDITAGAIVFIIYVRNRKEEE